MTSAAMACPARATAVVAKTRVGTGRNPARPATRVVVDAAASFGTTNSRRVSSSRRTRVASRLGSSAARDAEAAAEKDERGAEGATPAMNAEVVAAMKDAASVAPEEEQTVDGAEEAEPTPTPTPASERTRTGNVEDLLSRTRGDPPLFFSPSAGDLTLAPPDVSKPLMLYVPGLDGTGFAASPQFDRLERSFDLKAMHVPPTDRSDFKTLVETIATFLEEETTRREAAGEKPRSAKKGKKKFQRDGSVYLLGESMGGLLSLGVALRRPDLVDRLVLVNPASSFDRSPWPSVGPLLPSLPEEIYGGVPYALAPVLFEPAALITGGLDAVARAAKASGLAVDGPFGVPVPDVAKIVANGVGGAPAVIGDSIAALVDALGSQFPTLGALTAVIPRDTLAHRLSVLAAGCEVVNAPGALRSIDVPALCVASSEDLLIPSGDEGPRLRREMRRCRVEVLEGASHAALQKDECDLLEVMAKNGFKPRAAQDPPPLSNDEGFMPPSAAELERAFESLEPLRRITSPVFFSTKANGQIVQGIDAVPLGTKGAPVLLVGNHQTLAPDLGFLVQEFIRERGTLVRGLAHPVVAGGGARAAAKAKEEEKKRNEDKEKKEKDANEGDGGSNAFPFWFPDLRELVERDWSGGGTAGGGTAGAGAGPFGEGGAPGGGPGGVGMFTTFGAVPVSGMNFYRLLDAGETVLLFPGGVREAFKRRNEEYKLFWPSKPEFVRMAVRHGAVIVPFAAVGAEDGVDIVADADDIARLPFGLGEAAIERSRAVPSARAVDTRVTDDGVGEETFVQPLVVPKTPRRYYFKFGAPVYTGGLRETGFADDDEAVQAMYDGVKADVEEGIDWLLRRRRDDPFGDTAYRVLYEAASGKPAGTFYADENVETRT